MEDIGQLIFVVLFILFGLISSSKKKAQTRPRVRGATLPDAATPSRPRVQEMATTEAELQPPPEAPAVANDIAPPKRGLAEELLVFLQGHAAPVGDPIVLPTEDDDEAVSLETLEPAGAESHERFHERYVDAVRQQSPYEVEETPAPRPYAVTETPVKRPCLVEAATTPQPYAIHCAAKKKKRLTRRELRHAFVMKEVLGPPKALE